MNSENWRHGDVWKRKGNHFLVEVSRHTTVPNSVVNHWCVYLYLYPKHPAFSQGTDAFFECHSYVSYRQAWRNEKGEITAYQIGWDYQHDGDFYEEYTTPFARIELDAERLFKQAAEWNEEDGESP